MNDREKATRGLEECLRRFRYPETGCNGCPYYNPDKTHNCWADLFLDALRALRAEEVTGDA